MASTVLITTAIDPPPTGVPFLAMTNPAMRYIATKAAIYFWACQGVRRIVIADATGRVLLSKDETAIFEKMHVDVEQIHCQQDEGLIQAYGKGYGEGQLLKFALDNSLLLQSGQGFFKSTGKIYCRNFADILSMIAVRELKQIFWRHLDGGGAIKPWVDFRFFYTSKQFCEDHIIPAYLLADDRLGNAAEYFGFNVLNERLTTASALRPSLSGYSGGSGGPCFDLSFGALDANYPCWIG